jgi:hypothetical protein
MYWRRIVYSYSLIAFMMSQQAVTDFMLGQHLRLGLKTGILSADQFGSGGRIGSEDWMNK